MGSSLSPGKQAELSWVGRAWRAGWGVCSGRAITWTDPLRALRSAKRFETTEIPQRLASASRSVAKLKGVAASIPSQRILLNTLGLHEAKDSSAIANTVTTHDALFRFDALADAEGSSAAKEVAGYRQALWIGYQAVWKTGLS